MNRSEAEFTVEQTDESYAVRYALAGIRQFHGPPSGSGQRRSLPEQR